MRLTDSEKIQLINEAYAKTVDKAVQDKFDIDSEWFLHEQMMLLADLVADDISETYRDNILWALNKDE